MGEKFTIWTTEIGVALKDDCGCGCDGNGDCAPKPILGYVEEQATPATFDYQRGLIQPPQKVYEAPELPGPLSMRSFEPQTQPQSEPRMPPPVAPPTLPQHPSIFPRAPMTPMGPPASDTPPMRMPPLGTPPQAGPPAPPPQGPMAPEEEPPVYYPPPVREPPAQFAPPESQRPPDGGGPFGPSGGGFGPPGGGGGFGPPAGPPSGPTCVPPPPPCMPQPQPIGLPAQEVARMALEAGEQQIAWNTLTANFDAANAYGWWLRLHSDLAAANVPCPNGYSMPPNLVYGAAGGHPMTYYPRQPTSMTMPHQKRPMFTHTAMFPGTDVVYSEVPIQTNNVQTERGFDHRWVDDMGSLASNALGDSLYAYMDKEGPVYFGG